MHLAIALALLSALLAISGLCAAQAADPAKQLFSVLEYQVEGNSVLGTEPIERAVYPFLGESRSYEDVEAARAALEQTYRDAGYGTVSVDVPPQRVVDGVVVLRVVEGRIARLRVAGSRYFSQGRILEQVPALAEGTVPRLPEVQQQLVGVNNSLDRRVTPLLRPGKETGHHRSRSAGRGSVPVARQRGAEQSQRAANHRDPAGRQPALRQPVPARAKSRCAGPDVAAEHV